MVWLFVVNFGYSWGPCGWVIISEVWPLSNRAYGIALGASSNWMSNFIVGQITPIMLKKITFGTFIFFGILTFGGGAFIWFFVPETKRLTLEEMDVLFGSKGVAEAVSLNPFLWCSVPCHEILCPVHRLASLYAPLDTNFRNAQDSRRMAEINKEIGLEDVLQGMGMGRGRTDSGGETSSSGEDEKKGGFGRGSTAKEIESVG